MQDDIVVVDVANQVQATMKRHLWYFCEILNGLAYFCEILNGLAFFEKVEETEYAGETYNKLALGKHLKLLEEESSLAPSKKRRLCYLGDKLCIPCTRD